VRIRRGDLSVSSCFTDKLSSSSRLTITRTLLTSFRRYCLECPVRSREVRLARYKLTIEYAGTKYSGWQIQKNARTIQGEIEAAVQRVTRRQDFELYGSGRTDAGVHAVGQVAHLDVATTLAPGILRHRVNDELPADIHILSADKVSHRFHARHDAVARRYVYQVALRRTALSKAFVWWVRDTLDLKAMRDASRAFTGMKDFQAFAATDPELASSTLVHVERLEIARHDDLILVVIEGSHFLWKMVRRLVGVLVEIGRGVLEPADAARLIAAPSGVPARLTAPASGLFLERVFYAGDARGATVAPITPLRSAEGEPQP
jgi:tRNA pseudouridine38-40 synthase